MGQRPIEMTGTVTVSGLTVGKSYSLYRYDNTASLPVDGSHDDPHNVKINFQATNLTYVYEDPVKILSHSATYYRCFETTGVTFSEE